MPQIQRTPHPLSNITPENTAFFAQKKLTHRSKPERISNISSNSKEPLYHGPSPPLITSHLDGKHRVSTPMISKTRFETRNESANNPDEIFGGQRDYRREKDDIIQGIRPRSASRGFGRSRTRSKSKDILKLRVTKEDIRSESQKNRRGSFQNTAPGRGNRVSGFNHR